MSEKIANQQVEAFLQQDSQWQQEYQYLRQLIFEQTELEETYKWMHPCYTINNKNVVLIHGFKNYVALLFHKGAILDDQYQTLIQQTDKVQAARQLRFTSLDEIKERTSEIKYYLEQAIEVEKAGKKVEMKKTEDYIIPKELEETFEAMPQLESSFYKLTPGRQRQYIHHISQAKRSETRKKRVEKYINQILAGKGMHDK
ncbi:YdeI family protein [Staphylococcus simiae]|uniref:YdeI/OmpD-associated family protein n=1 Tax=Staphylococcus simiae TaxID=308354 RepID=UPI001A96321D|nr:YdeI family protein [Staphylococcus simiae]MBO1198537.1 YdeI family protein [Staphylococcus simiae]MBO1200665.1 YdeI family protein [Staphylococcus simiae]MBO1202943.1 YdeI family protein [Staphylococcus simiae]MBO1210528.1 YdeI family protein [Staphylococcus simiae]MBO1229009.1 YdeI family protein [Staphylococcus simiae]